MRACVRSRAQEAAYLFGGPERRLRLLVHLPDVLVLDGEDDEAPRVVLQQGLLLLLLLLPRVLLLLLSRPALERLKHRNVAVGPSRLKLFLSPDDGRSAPATLSPGGATVWAPTRHL